MTRTLTTSSESTLAAYTAREAALRQVREVLEQTDTWEALIEGLEARGLPEARVRQLADTPVTLDLHLHSTHSDGQIPAYKLAWLARLLGLRTIALADHDSISGCRACYGEAMLLDVSVLPAVELSTEQPGLELLVYFPDAGRFFDFLTTPRGIKFTRYLEAKQRAVHEATLRAMASVNRWLRRQGIAADRQITEQELDAWYGGQQPYFPGTLAVLGLKRLDAAQRKALGIHDPRKFNTKVVTPALKRLAALQSSTPATTLDEAVEPVRRQIASIRSGATDAVVVLSHPKELVTKGRMSLGEVAKTIERLVERVGLDGVEVGCARDTEADVRMWREIMDDTNARIERGDLKAIGPLIMASYTSDFHVLAPGLATGEITLGFGLMDERPEHRRGNLRPQTTPEELIEALRHRGKIRGSEA
jgi:hypothetical protein